MRVAPLRSMIAGTRARLARAISFSAGALPVVDDVAAGLVYVLVDPVDQAKPRTLITFLGEPPANIGEIVVSVAVACQLRGEYPVVVMSELRPDLIASSPAPIEFVPSARHLPFGAEEYQRYVHRRWSLMVAKWNFAKQIDLNMSFDDFVGDQAAHQDVLPEADSYVLASIS